jgi:hypothetical protein
MSDSLPTGKISDLKKFAEERKQLASSSSQAGHLCSTHGGPNSASSRKTPMSPIRGGGLMSLTGNMAATMSAPLLERPASRIEILSLEAELEERVRLVLDSSSYQRHPNEFGLEFNYAPHKESMMLTRERMLSDLSATATDLSAEPWLDSYVKCECLKSVSDDISSRFADMLGVNSTELGNYGSFAFFLSFLLSRF